MTTNNVVNNSGGTAAATQAEQEAGSSTSVYVSPGRQQFHPSASKMWASFAGNSTTILSSYNVTSLTNNATGDTTVNYTTNFSSVNYGVAGICAAAGSGGGCVEVANGVFPTVSAVRIRTLDTVTGGGTFFNSAYIGVSAFGDQ